MSYIGNGPNFMVKTLAESAGVKMPSFFGYLRWSFLILTPLFAIVSLVFFV
jgi:Na+/H+ antiporter NhaD/arsenite permease-like protein